MKDFPRSRGRLPEVEALLLPEHLLGQTDQVETPEEYQ